MAFGLRRYDTGELLGWKQLGTHIEQDYGAPYYHIHRADLHRLLLENARKYATVHFDCPVSAVDASIPSITLSSGEVIKTQLILGADGIHSRVRNVVVGTRDSPIPIGDESYRSLIPAELIAQDPDLKPLLHEGVNNWMGPKKHIVGYCVRQKQLYNIVMVHPSRDRNEVTREVDPAIMRQDFQEFEPRVQKLLSLVDSTMVWSLMDRKSLDKWVHDEGKVCLVGDACHPMLPYRAQGAAMALEDAAVIGKLLSNITHNSDVPSLLRAYQEIRLPRTDIVQQEARMNRTIFHMDDGPDQERRDRSMKQAMEVALREAQEGEKGADCAGTENLWGDRKRTDNVFGYDADAAVDQWLKMNQLGSPQVRL
jgi:salicylate hydroxylase